jgi:hypothetical protein
MSKKLTEKELIEQFDEVLDSISEVEVIGYKFTTSRVLKTLDLIAYREELAAYADDLIRDGYEIEGW